jgi:magnesium-protoporphyrin O-methyltransferase
VTCSQCVGIERRFDAAMARRKLRAFRRSGPSATTESLVSAILLQEGGRGGSFLDIGGGVGAIQLALLGAGAPSGTSVDASPAYLTVAREEAAARGVADRMRYVGGDFVAVQGSVDAADVVTLDRVICCYPDMPALVDAAAARARGVLGMVYPRDRGLARLVLGIFNLLHALVRHPFRAYVHATDAVESRIEDHGMVRSFHRETMLWQVAVFTRPGQAAGGGAADAAEPSSTAAAP